MKEGWQCPRCYEKWENDKCQPCNHLDITPVRISFMDPAEMIAKYGPPIKPLNKPNKQTIPKGEGMRGVIQRHTNKRGAGWR